MMDTIGIDISKDTLDTYWLSKRKHKQFANTKTGLKALINWVRQAEVPLVVFEATGVYHRLLAKGKCKKLAITAVMRKLVVMANAVLRDGRKWTEITT